MQSHPFDTYFKSPTLNRHFAMPPSLADQPPPQTRLIRAFRLTVLFGKAGKCPIAQIMPLVGGMAAAAHFVRVVQVLGAHWPEAIRIYRPCCPKISADEMLLLDMVNFMVGRDLAGFRALLCDMLTEEAIGAIEVEIADFTARHIRPRHRV